MASLDTSSPLRSPGGVAALTVERLQDKPFRGIGFTLLAMAIFSMMDGMSKFLAVDYPPVEIAWGRFFFVFLFVLPLALRPEARRRLPSRFLFRHLVRGLCMLGSSIFFIFALAALPIAEASAIGFVSPLMTTALSIPLLGEKVGIRRWSAVVVGFIGVLVVMRPGTGAFEAAALLPICSSACWALGLIITRQMQASEPVLTTLFYSTLVGLVLTTVALPWSWTPLSAEGWTLLLLQGVLSVVAQYFLIRAFSYAGASLLAPFSYSQMLWSTLIGFFVFHQLPDLPTWIGAAIIIASGLYTLHRERVVRARDRRARQAA
jgi:drug/metabolite transporter (DMT)-like permease